MEPRGSKSQPLGQHICLYFALTDLHPDQPEREQDEAFGAICVCRGVFLG